jgi:hypothetical protein
MAANTLFTPTQQRVVTDVMTESSTMLGSDSWQLEVLDPLRENLGLTGPVTYAQALAAVGKRGRKVQARDFVRAVLALRGDERVQGEEVVGLQPGAGSR